MCERVSTERDPFSNIASRTVINIGMSALTAILNDKPLVVQPLAGYSK